MKSIQVVFHYALAPNPTKTEETKTMTLKLPKIIGHRGCMAYAPENTLEGIHTAADMGVEWVELDVKLTKDQVPIIFHDDTLERVADVSGIIAQMNWAELKEIDVGLSFGESFIDVRIPTLEQAVDVLIDRDMGLNLEIKPCPGREKETAEAVLDILSGIWDDHERLLITSAQAVSLEVAHDMANDWARTMAYDAENHDKWKEFAEYLKLSAITLDGNTCTREQIEDALGMGKPVLAVVVNDPDRARDLYALGVSAILTDEPDVIGDVILTVH